VYLSISRIAKEMQIKFIIRIDDNLNLWLGRIVDIVIMPAAENNGERINREEERSACGAPIARPVGIAEVMRKI